jgi:hypothetical protein
LGRYSAPGGEMSLAILNYPTAAIARNVLEQFQATDGILAKRTGPFVVAVVHPPDPDDAQRLLARVDYRATISMDEPAPSGADADPGGFLIGLVKLIGVLLVGTLGFGAAFAGVRLLGQRYLGWSVTGARMLTLDIDRERPR